MRVRLIESIEGVIAGIIGVELGRVSGWGLGIV